MSTSKIVLAKVRSITHVSLTHIHVSLASFLWDIGKQYSPICDAEKCGVPSEAILFAHKKFIENIK